MSHELRTPLNSILVLGQQLTDNPDGNLTSKQVEFARTIHGAGTDLLNLITDILDLSKIESGTVSVQAEEVFFNSLLDMIARPFRHEAESRHLNFEVQTDPNLTRSMVTDSKRLQQVLKNLLSNAFKFTEHGSVRLSVFAAETGWSEDHPVLGKLASVVAFEVTDTGIGIPAEKQRLIFEAFQQADAGTSRKYGGTGLGLAISRELAGLLGGEIQLRSVPEKGSAFTLYLPQTYVGPSTGMATADAKMSAVSTERRPSVVVSSERSNEQIPDDRENLKEDDAILLIVEDDPHYARLLRDLSRDKGFKVLVASRGTEALELAREFHPTAVSLDVFLPDMLGWTVLNHFKQDPTMRHIPVQMLTMDEDRQHGLASGAFAYVNKPARTSWKPHSRVSRNIRHRAVSGCWWWKTILASSSVSRNCSDMTTLMCKSLRLAKKRCKPLPTNLLTAWCSICACPICRDSIFSSVSAKSRHSAICRWWSLPVRICPLKKTPACTCSHAAWLLKESNRQSGCSTKRPCSCIAWSPIFRRKSRRCSSACIIPTKR
jgi:CheY-like chemotaxis protein